jgi:hypothetical protein
VIDAKDGIAGALTTVGAAVIKIPAVVTAAGTSGIRTATVFTVCSGGGGTDGVLPAVCGAGVVLTATGVTAGIGEDGVEGVLATAGGAGEAWIATGVTGGFGGGCERGAAGLRFWGGLDQARIGLSSKGSFSKAGLDPPGAADRPGWTAPNGWGVGPFPSSKVSTGSGSAAAGLPPTIPSRRAISPALDGRPAGSFARQAAMVVSHAEGIGSPAIPDSARHAAINGASAERICEAISSAVNGGLPVSNS